MYPAVVVLCDEGGEADLSRLLHLDDEFEQAAVVIKVACDESCCATKTITKTKTKTVGASLVGAIKSAEVVLDGTISVVLLSIYLGFVI